MFAYVCVCANILNTTRYALYHIPELIKKLCETAKTNAMLMRGKEEPAAREISL